MPLQTVRRSKAVADIGIAALERKATEAAGLLKLLANENRLLILCRLVVAGEMSVGDLADAVDLSQSALSQRSCLSSIKTLDKPKHWIIINLKE